VPRDETLRQQHRRGLIGEARTHAGVHLVSARHRQSRGPRVLVGERDRIEPVARVAPSKVQALRTQVSGAERRRQQFALGEHVGLPVEREARRTRIARQGAQLGQAIAKYHVRIQTELAGELAMPCDQRLGRGPRLDRAVGDGLQRIGHTRQRGHHHQHALTVLGHAP
jgi:hypothetical protein